MAKQLASVPEESSTDFTALSPRSYSYRESFLSVAGPEWRIRSTLSSQSGQSGSNHSSISGAGDLFNIPGSASAGAADFGADELHQGRSSSSIHKVSSSLAKELASVSEDSTTGSSAPCPPSNSYRESIRSVAWPEWRIRSALSSQSGQSGSSYSSISGASSSYLSNISGCSSGFASASAVDFGADELTKIAHTMISDGYTPRMVRAFKYGGAADQVHALETWFSELDISWVLQMPELQGTPASSLEELVERWTRALTIIVASIKELVAAVHESPSVGRFGKASISAMLDFVAVFHDYKVEKVQTIVHMYICVSSASYNMRRKHLTIDDNPLCSRILANRPLFAATDMGFKCAGGLSSTIFDQICTSLETEENRLIQKLSNWVWVVKCKLMKEEYDGSWAIEIMRGGAEVHKNTRLMADCIVLMMKALNLTCDSAQSQNTGKLRVLIDDTIDFLKDLLVTKSKRCLDPSLGYMFLLNNSHYVEQVCEPASISLNVDYFSSAHHRGLKLVPEYEKYMDSYLEVSWGHVLSCLSSPSFPGPLGRWINTSPLAKFHSAFHKTYQTQKFWKVPDPLLRSLLRRTITKMVVSGYRDYLMEHPELKKQVRGGSSSPDSLEEMLGELFEG